MPISSLVITLGEEVWKQDQAIGALKRNPRLVLGNRFGVKLPVVAETRSLSEGRRLVEALELVEGIVLVDVVSVNFEDSQL